MAAGKSYILAISDVWPPQVGGSGTYLSNLLVEVKRSIVIVGPHVKGKQTEYYPHSVHRLYRLNLLKGGPFNIYSLLHRLENVIAPLYDILRIGKLPELVICNQILFTGLVGIILKKIFGIPYTVVAYGEELTVWIKYRAYTYLATAVMRNSSRVVAISKFTAEVVCRDYGIPSELVEIINPSLDSSTYDISSEDVQRTTRAFGLQNKRFIFMAGRLIPRKGFDKAIEALPLIISQIPDIHLVIVGSGEYKPYLEQLALEKGVLDKIQFIRELDRLSLLSLYAACEIFLLPNRRLADGDTEGFGIVFLEANLMERPVVGGREGGALDAIQDGVSGLQVDGNDPNQIAQAVLTLLKNPSLAKELGEMGRRRAINQFDLRVASARYAEVLDKILNSELSH